jgi:hypothetical protein
LPRSSFTINSNDMVDDFGLYPDLYVKRPEFVFPLIEKYTGKKISSTTTHKEVAGQYISLLNTNVAFRKEIDNYIALNKDKLWNTSNRIAKKNPKPNAKPSVANGGSLDPAPVALDFTRNSSGVWTEILDIASELVGSSEDSKTAEAKADQAFYETILNQQKENSTSKLVVISILTVVILGAGIYLYLKMSKKS